MRKIFYLLFLIPFSMLGQWTQVSSLPSTFQTHHSFGFAINNTGYVVTGGFNNQFGTPQFSEEFYSYSPSTDVWTQMDDFPGGKRGFGIGDVANEKAYFGFGLSDHPSTGAEIYHNDLWEFDPITSNWTELATCPCQPRIHPTFLTHNNKIYLGLGGAEFGNLNDWWEYDIATNTWAQKTDFPSYERHHPYQFSIGDYVYTGFGHGSAGAQIYDAWYRYDPSNDSWLEVESLPAEGRVAGTQFSHNDMGYVLSGDGENHSSMGAGEFWQYNGDADSWFQMPSHPGSSRWAPASFILEDNIYIINGTSFNDYIDEVYKYDLNFEPVNIQEIEQKDDISISPNPFTDIVSIQNNTKDIELNSLSFQIVNTLGVIMMESNIINSTKIDLSELSNGIYIINFISANEVISKQKVLKQ